MKSFSWLPLLIGLISPEPVLSPHPIPLAATNFVILEMSREIPQLINRPPGARRPLLGWYEGSRKACLYYHIPTKENSGRVFFQYQKDQIGQKCHWDSTGREFLVREGLANLRASFVETKNQVRLIYSKSQKEHRETWDLFNGVSSSAKKWERYSNGAPERAIPGVYFVPEKGHGDGPSLLGKKNDRYKNGDAVLCHQFGPDCKEVFAFQCQRCRYGYFEVLTNICPGKTQKYCGRNRCGEFGEPACLRGFRHTNPTSLCTEKTPHAFCQIGLNVACNSKGELICR